MKPWTIPLDVAEALRVQRNAIDMLESELDEQFDGVLDALRDSTSIVSSGVGKSGFVARKFAASLTSLGLPATYMHSVDALHGDLGLVRPGSVLVMFSKSGETREVIDLINLIKEKKITVVCVTSRRSSTLSQRADYSLVAPIEREYDSNNILPTASTTSALIVADLIVMAMAHRLPDPVGVLSRTHPMGSIGSLLAQKVGSYMHRGDAVAAVAHGSSLESAIHELDSRALGVVCIVDEKNNLCGILTDGDVRRLVERSVDVSTRRVDDVMTTSPAVTSSSATLHEALLLMESPQRSISVLPVVDASRLVGVIRLHDVVRAQMAG